MNQPRIIARALSMPYSTVIKFDSAALWNTFVRICVLKRKDLIFSLIIKKPL